MWGVDYPHSEGTFPYSRQAISLTFSDVPPAEVADMLGLTAAKVFNFDVDHLQRLANRVGPTVAEVKTPPSSIPQIPDDTLSPVFATKLVLGRSLSGPERYTQQHDGSTSHDSTDH